MTTRRSRPGPDLDFWEQRFASNTTPWDRGEANPQLARWLDSGDLGPCSVIVPGCGSGYEVAVLAKAGFAVTALDYAGAAIERTGERVALLDAEARARVNLVRADATAWMPDAAVDAVYEQTCLCALHPDLWVDYARQLWRWIRPQGRLFALFAQVPRAASAEGFVLGPPYHCDINAMRALFAHSLWEWPAPPYPRVSHPAGMAELAIVLRRRAQPS
ncbi:MAG: class I SAM-dependent methyltransferase [Burkholderiaceae bacterium]|nr:class I SAM-dependent methyltransferase [Burkholderiaceae bacterium]